MEQWRLGPVPTEERKQRLQTAPCVVFDAFRLDQRDELLWRGQEVLPLHPKTLTVLCCLVTQAGQLVTKDAALGSHRSSAAGKSPKPSC